MNRILLAFSLSISLSVPVGCSEAASPSTDAAAVPAEDVASEDTAAAADTAVADTGAPDPWDGGPPSAECMAHCTCMTEQCSTYSGYPYTTEKACTDHCGRFTAPQMKCWSYFCTAAKTQTGSTKSHTCQHAWGTWGLEECPK